MVPTPKISVQSASQDYEHGACAQDFETVIQSHLSPWHLRGLLNFSALWNRVTYIYDTAIGDNPHLIHGYLSAPPDNALYTTLIEFIRNDIVRCLCRDKITVEGADLITNPQISDIYDGWRLRDNDRPDTFHTQIFDERRNAYNRNIDRILFDEKPLAIRRYDPNSSKPRFRELIRGDLAQHGQLWQLVSRLPSEVVSRYERICSENDFFTTADLYIAIKDYLNLEKAADELLLMLGYSNQQALAESIHCGISGSDWGHPWRPEMFRSAINSVTASDPKTPNELLERAEFSLAAPALGVLALLSPDEINELRAYATTSVFGMAINEGASESELRQVTDRGVKNYWSHVCEYMYRKYPKYTREKTRMFAFVDKKYSGYSALNRKAPWIRTFVDVAVDVMVAYFDTVPGTGSVVKSGLKKVGYRLIYQPNDAFRALKQIEPKFWTPKATWASSVSSSPSA